MIKIQNEDRLSLENLKLVIRDYLEFDIWNLIFQYII